ncbi:MAG: GTP cyclohydrolase II [Betaproteobacteria bacterium HGW-Betaproteobacteria-21]|nr:MAG: GTP cyclohydrolase II [Betaproteobacteria bacterium HGW-Betaproteobacteria-21]
MRHAERAVFDLRRGFPVLLRGNHGDTLIAPMEGLNAQVLDDAVLLTQAKPVLVLSKHRLASLGLAVSDLSASLQFEHTPDCVQLLRLSLARAEALSADLPLTPLASSPEERAGLLLMRRAELIPAALAFPVAEGQRDAVERHVAEASILAVNTADVIALCESGPGRLTRVSDARVPLADLGDARFVLFREEDGSREHVAVLIGERPHWPEAVPVRVHSACLTGDLFGSQRCDCGAQLRNSLAMIKTLGGGILLYLAQEGRGIGLANKLRAYRLQDEGLDTIDADQVIGFGKDERDYRVAHEMLDALDVQRIELLTNNPEKVSALRDAGIEVVSRRALFGQLNDHNHFYLRTKADRHGHLLEELLARPV